MRSGFAIRTCRLSQSASVSASGLPIQSTKLRQWDVAITTMWQKPSLVGYIP